MLVGVFPEDERLAQAPVGHAVRLRAAKVAQGEDLEAIYSVTGSSLFDDLTNPEFQRLLEAHANPPRMRKKKKAA